MGLSRLSIVILLFLSLAWGCTATRWVPLNNPAVDRSEPTLLEEGFLPELIETPRFANPIYTFSLARHRETRYPLRVQKERTLQDYKPNWPLWSLGLGSAIASFYMSRTGDFNSTTELGIRSNMFLLGGLGIMTGTLLNMKPTGTPIRTGEIVLLKQEGSVVELDTSKFRGEEYIPLRSSVQHPVIGLVEINDFWQKGSYQIDLQTVTNWPVIRSLDPGVVGVRVITDNDTMDVSTPVSDFMYPYVTVSSEIAVLYTSAEETSNNAIIEIERGSKLQFNRLVDEEWIEAQFGISQVFIKQNKVILGWEFPIREELNVVRGQTVPFGRIDVERGLSGVNKTLPNARAFLFAPEIYASTVDQENQGRGLRLMNYYATELFGIRSKNVAEFTDSLTQERVFESLNSISEQDDLFIYLSGEAEFDLDFGILLKVDRQEAKLSVRELVLQLSRKAPRSVTMLFDAHVKDGQRDTWVQEWGLLWSILKNERTQVSMFVNTSLPNKYRWYSNPAFDIDFKHRIFTYFFAKGLKEGLSGQELISFLKSEVDFASRNVHDEPQIPLIFGENVPILSPSNR